MRKHQRGVTFLGWLFLLTPMALVLYAAIRLLPVYMEYMKIARTLEQVQEEFKGDQIDVYSLRTAIEKRFDIESVNVMTVKDVDKLKITREEDHYVVQAVYTHSVPYIQNVSLQVNFDKKVIVD